MEVSLKSKNKPIDIISLTGSPTEMGKQFGAKYKDQIKQLAQARMQRLINFTKKYGKINISEQEVLTIANSLLDTHKNFDNNIWTEFCAIANSAEISLEWLLVANSYTDLRDYVCKTKGFNDTEVRFEGCSAFLLDKTMSSENNILLGQTWDMSIEAMDYLVIVKKPNQIYLTTMGGMALIGLNKHGLAIGTTNLMANDSQKGVNYLFTITRFLNSNNYKQALNNIFNLDNNNYSYRMSGHSFLCVDNNNAANLLECSAKNYVNYQLDHYPIVITNNYSNIMREHEIFIPEARHRNSIFRQVRTMELLVERQKWSKQDLWHKVLSDNYRSSSGGAICNEDYNGKYGEFATCATVLLDAQNKEMLVCRGGALSGVMQKVYL